MNVNRTTSMLSTMVWTAALGACSSSGADGAHSAGVEGGAAAASNAALAAAARFALVSADPPFAAPLPIPPRLTPTSRDATTDYYNLAIRSGSAQMRDGTPTPIVGFDGVVPGPTIAATRGRTVQVTQTNEWTENVSVHNHGHKVAATSDGHPTDYIAPGTAKVYTYPNDQNAGTYWYHDHTMDLTGPHVYQGLAGFYIIEDPAEEALGLPSGSHDIPLLIQDKAFNSDNSLSYQADHFFGFFGDTAVVNGAVTPHLDVGTSKFRFRVLNGSNARPLTLELQVSGSGVSESFQVIASDGGLLAAPVASSALPIGPAERYDIVVDFSKFPVGTKLDLVNTAPWGPDQGVPALTNVMQFVVAESEVDTSVVPSTLANVQRHDPADAVGTRDISFQFEDDEWTMNGLSYDPERIDIRSDLDQVYIWSLTNESSLPHPFHKHLSEFNVLDIDGQPPSSIESGWKDTVMVQPGSNVRIIFKNETFTGTYVFHCHNLEHEDHRMMLQEQVGN